MDNFIDHAFDELKDEIEGACEYLNQADDAEAQGHHYLAMGLHHIAKDEYTHANFLRDYLISKKKYHESERHKAIEERWHKLRGRLGLES